MTDRKISITLTEQEQAQILAFADKVAVSGSYSKVDAMDNLALRRLAIKAAQALRSRNQKGAYTGKVRAYRS